MQEIQQKPATAPPKTNLFWVSEMQETHQSERSSFSIKGSLQFGVRAEASRAERGEEVALLEMAERAPVAPRGAAERAPPKKAASGAAKARKPSGPSVTELLTQAVSASKERGGVSLAALKKSLAAAGYDVEKNNSRIKLGLKSLVTKGTLVQTKGTGASGSFKLNKKQADAKDKVVAKKKPASAGAAKSRKPAAKKPASAAKRVKKAAAVARGAPRAKVTKPKKATKNPAKASKPQAKAKPKASKGKRPPKK
ncbi:UNVERIFIED_CONTAM: hypothetical protein K2H54_042669 [Gekko kuhli]